MKFSIQPQSVRQREVNYYELSAVFFALLLSYAAKFTEFFEFDFVMLGWGAVSLYALCRIRWALLAIPAIFHVVLFLAYAVGVAFVSLNSTEFEYARVLLTSFVLAGLVFALLIEKSSVNFIDRELPGFGVFLIYAGPLMIAAWALFVYMEGKSVGGSVVKEYGGANYLTSADLLAMFSLTVLGSRDTTVKLNLFYFSVTSVALVMLGSRASALIFCVSYLFCLGRFKRRGRFFLIAGLLLVLGAIGSLIISDQTDLFFRFRVLSDLGADESLNARQELLNNHIANVATRTECIFLPCTPSTGDYVHSIISVHQYFGVAGVIAIGLIIFLTLIYMVKFRKFFLPGLFVYVALNMFFARAWISLVFPVLIGMSLFFSIRVLSKKARR